MKIFIRGIGKIAPNPSSMHDENSKTSLLSLARMTTFQRAAISNPSTGRMVMQINGTPSLGIKIINRRRLLKTGEDTTSILNGFAIRYMKGTFYTDSTG